MMVRPSEPSIAPPQARAEVDALTASAWALRRQDPERALAQAEGALELATRLGYKRGQAESLLVLSFVRIGRGELDAAEAETLRARSLLDPAAGRVNLAKVANLLGIINGERGQLAEALEHILEAHALFKGAGDEHEAASALSNAAAIYTYLGNYDSALETYLKALRVHEAVGDDEGIARTLSGLGMAYVEMGHYSEALDYLRRSLDLDATRADAHALALVHMNIGRAYTATGALEQALDFTRKGVRQLEALGDRSGLSYALDTMGRIYRKRGEALAAERYFGRALAIKLELGDRIGQAMSRLSLGRLLMAQDLDAALGVLQSGLADAREAEGKAEIYKLHLALADAHEQAGDYRRALEHHRAYTEVKDAVFNETSDRNLQSLRLSFQVQQTEKEREIYRLRNIELARANTQKQELVNRLERQAREDGLTGLYNRRYFDTRLAEAFDKARNHGSPLSLMICDLDHFKQINDGYSHQVGDEVLQTLATIFLKLIRKTDTVARYGGEEFVLLMPDTRLVDALTSCERLRAAVESYPWHDVAPGLTVTLSGGLTADMSLASGEKMVARADTLLYEAKRGGRNRIHTDRKD